MAEAKIGMLMLNEAFDSLQREMINKGSIVEAGFLLFGYELGNLPIATDYLFVSQGHRTQINAVHPIHEMVRKHTTQSYADKALHLKPVFELGNKQAIQRLVNEGYFKLPEYPMELPDGNIGVLEKKIVGGAHTHPNLRVVLSPADLKGINMYLQFSKINPMVSSKLPWVEIVHDPVNRKMGIFESDGRSSNPIILYVGNTTEINEFLRQIHLN